MFLLHKKNQFKKNKKFKARERNLFILLTAKVFMDEKIIVLDFGGQYAHLIARRVRELGVYSEIMLPNASIEKLSNAKGIILSGSPKSITDKTIEFNSKILKLGIPLLGICYGHQLLAKHQGGKIGKSGKREFGKTEIEIKNFNGLFAGTPQKQIVWMSHYDQVTEMPPGFELLATTSECKIAAMGNPALKHYGVQFHPEVVHTEHGMEIISNFVFDICKCKRNWSVQNYLEKEIEKIKKKTKNKKVLLLASGGVDSTVTLALLARTLPHEQLFAVHIDTGFMRKNETRSIKESLEKIGFTDLHVVNAEKEFLSALEGVTEPEEKRKIIGKLFVDLTEREIKKTGIRENDWLLAQGTIYPDTIETARTKHADKIKTHHNRVEQIVKMIEMGNVIEPLEQLYKDEVRELGRELGLPEELIWRHPFPGPGLAIRVLCSNGAKSNELISLEKKALQTAKHFGFGLKVLPVRSVGVAADLRTYARAALLEGEIDWEKLGNASTNLTNEFNELNRAVVALHPKKIKKIELLKAGLSRERIEILRKADAVVQQEIKNAGLYKNIWQFPVILLPLKVNGSSEAIVLRPVESREAMTAEFYKMPIEVLERIVKRLLEIKGIGAVFYDVSNKPPATIEWE